MSLDDRLHQIHDMAAGGQAAEAVTLAEQVLNEYPNDAKTLAVVAYAFMKIERFGVAYTMLEKACAKSPDKSALWSNLGMCALGCMDFDLSAKHLKHALKLDPQNGAAMNNLALVYVNKGEPGLAIEWGEKSRKIRGDDPALMESLGYAHLMLGHWKQGWEGFDGALYGKIRVPRTYQSESYWDGKPVDTLVIRGEQGIGDEISFASVYADAEKAAGNIIIECDKRLEGLFQRSFPYPVVGTRFQKDIPWSERVKVDAHVLSGSLCRYFRNEDAAFPGTPYLKADPERRIQWRALLDSLGTKKKVGIAWNGGRHNTNANRRSLKLAELLPILKADCDFVCLEYKSAAQEVAMFHGEHGIKVHHWPRATEVPDYDETAALVAELDLVISVQTAIVHLAGALGVPAWVLVPSKPHWRYGMTGDSMPWYRSVRLFRQKSEWSGAINQVAGELNGPR